jgi:hypothetical protein
MNMIRYRIKKGILSKPEMVPDDQGQWVTHAAAKIEIESLTEVIPPITPPASPGTTATDLVESQIRVANLTLENANLKVQAKGHLQNLEEMKELLEDSHVKIETHLRAAKETMKDAAEVRKMADDVLLNAPNLRPFEAMFENTDPDKSVLEVWGQAMWAQLTKEVKADILLTYAHSLADLDSISGRAATVQPRQNPYLTQQPPAQDSSMAPQEKTAANQDLNGTSSAPSA